MVTLAKSQELILTLRQTAWVNLHLSFQARLRLVSEKVAMDLFKKRVCSWQRLTQFHLEETEIWSYRLRKWTHRCKNCRPICKSAYFNHQRPTIRVYKSKQTCPFPKLKLMRELIQMKSGRSAIRATSPLRISFEWRIGWRRAIQPYWRLLRKEMRPERLQGSIEYRDTKKSWKKKGRRIWWLKTCKGNSTRKSSSWLPSTSHQSKFHQELLKTWLTKTRSSNNTSLSNPKTLEAIIKEASKWLNRGVSETMPSSHSKRKCFRLCNQRLRDLCQIQLTWKEE